MALDERKLLELMINKFNEEYHASHQYDNFLIYPIPPNALTIVTDLKQKELYL